MTCRESCVLSFLIDAGSDQTAEIHADPRTDTDRLREGDIFIARIETVFPGMRAAFVKGGRSSEEFYLPLEDIRSPVFTRKSKSEGPAPGDELLVQVSREAMKGKAAAVTCNLSLRGRYAVLFAESAGLGVSKKLAPQVRSRLKELGGRWLSDSARRGFALLLRSAAGEASDEDILQEAEELEKKLEKILSAAPFRGAGSVLYQNPPRYLTRIMHMRPCDLDRIITDDPVLCEQLREALTDQAVKEKLFLHEDPMISLQALYSLGHRLSRAVGRKISLPSGANIVIENTEAMTVIDVNTAKNISLLKKKTKEEALLKTNLQAAEEIARQLRLRNLSGIIIIDFINMQENESGLILMKALEGFLQEDPVRTVLVDMTKLGLVEITRKKTEPPLLEAVRACGIPDSGL